MLPPRPFVLPGWIGWACNLLGIAYVVVTSVLFVFPPELPVGGSNMNYCIVAFAIILIVSTVQWFVDGRKNFKGPKVEFVGEEVEEGDEGGYDGMDGKRGEMDGNGLSEMGGEGRKAEMDGEAGLKEMDGMGRRGELGT